MSETLVNGRDETGYVKAVYSEFLEVRECGKVAQGASVEPFGSDLGRGMTRTTQADLESFGEWKQAKFV